jgi:hypothetical protein
MFFRVSLNFWFIAVFTPFMDDGGDILRIDLMMTNGATASRSAMPMNRPEISDNGLFV